MLQAETGGPKFYLNDMVKVVAYEARGTVRAFVGSRGKWRYFVKFSDRNFMWMAEDELERAGSGPTIH